MSDIVSKWILHRLGIVIDTTSSNFALETANGLLLAQVLKSYEIITADQLNLIKDSDHTKDCYENFTHINVWLKHLNFQLEEDDVHEIVNGVGSTSLHLFYQIFIELKDKTKLDFLTEIELNAQLGKDCHRFYVKKIEDSEDVKKLDLHKNGLCAAFLTGGDVYHWYKDRMETLNNRCKDARDEYIHCVKNRCRSFTANHGVGGNESGFVLARSLWVSPKPSSNEFGCYDLPSENLDSFDGRTYEDLVNEQKEAQKLPPFNPNPKEVKKILKHLHTKSKVRLENKTLRNQFHQEIMNAFDKKINSSKAKSEDHVLINMFMKQSQFEKELVTKLGQVKAQKEFMVENKCKQGEVLIKLKEKNFMDELVLKNKELNEAKLTYYLERERVLQLHKKVWDERLRLRAKRHEDICSKAVKDMVDISIKISEHKKRFGKNPNKREMEFIKNLFVSGQSVFDICEPITDILKDSGDEICETIVTREMARQNAIDQEEFDSYMHYEWPWELKNVNTTSEVFQQIGYGLNVLGYIVHRALHTKYPIIPLRDKPQLADAAFRVCINGLNDPSILPSLRIMLSEREITVIELTQVVDFCIEVYRQESKREYDDTETSPIKELKQKKDKSPKPKKGEKSSSKKKGKTEEKPNDDINGYIRSTEEKMVQTPIKYPCEEIPYSPTAQLGRTAQEILDEGLPLGDFLLIDMFIEYLKHTPNLKGWVLVNYPTNFEQAAILEEAFTGVKLRDPQIKFDDIKTLNDIAENEQNDEKDNCSLYCDVDAIRVSRLLPNPIIPEPLKFYDTILTAYIKMRKLVYDDKSGDTVLPPVYEELGNEPDPLDKFYSNAGANYSMYYKEFDLSTVKYLGKLIIGDYSLPLKTSVELFGDVINADHHPSKAVKSAKKGDKLKKPKERMPHDLTTNQSDKTSAKVVADKKDKKGKTKVVIVFEDKSVQVPTEDEEEFEESDQSASTLEIPRAGQPGWDYCNIDCPEELLIILAALWETVEEIYINDLKQVFFLIRLNLNSYLPFARYVKDTMKTIIDQPDYKGFYLSKFQRAFNTFDMDYRKDDEFKAEMHCRIEDFKEKLIEMCDVKMMESENIRCRIISAGWVPNQISELINEYISMLQIEIDRFIESIRLINNYYLGIIIGMPTEEDTYRDENIPKCRETCADVVNIMFQDITSVVDLTYFDELLTMAIQRAQNCIKKANTLTTNSIEKTKSSQASNQKSKSKASSPKSKASKDTKKTVDLDSTIIKDNYDRLLEEWQCAVKGETLRINLRIDLLKYNALISIEEFLTIIQQSFHEVYDELRSRYRDELENINIACNIFRSAVENETLVQKELIFEGYTFRINPEVNLFDNPPIIPEIPKEIVKEGAFTIEQLSKLADIFLNLSPSGYMPKATFMFILQDILWVTPEDSSEWLSPELWRKLDSSSLKKIVDSLYDELEYVYWRDFIIYNIRVNYPTERELLLTRKALRECDPDATELIQDYQFFGTKLWFEYMFKKEDSKRITDIKRLLYKLYNIQNYGLNYTILLLDFCKDECSVEGFSKALELSIGKVICWDTEVGDLFKQEYLRRMKKHEDNVRKRDEERAEHYKAAYDEVSKLIDHVVHITEDVIIEDIDPPKEYESDKSGDGRSRQVSILKKSNGETESRRPSKVEELRFKDAVDVENIEVENDQLSEKNLIEKHILKRETSQIVKLYKELPDNVETESDETTEVFFFLSLDVLITVITAALPWHSRVQNFGDLSYWETAAQIFDECKNPNFNMSVLSHEFLNSDKFLVLLSLTKKFNIIDPVKVLYDILKESESSS